jgi:hypothetical protein
METEYMKDGNHLVYLFHYLNILPFLNPSQNTQKFKYAATILHVSSDMN